MGESYTQKALGRTLLAIFRTSKGVIMAGAE